MPVAHAHRTTEPTDEKREAPGGFTMYLNLGQTVVPTAEIVGIFDLDNTSWAFKTREFLERAEREGRAVWLTGDLPRSFVLCRDGRIYITQLSATVLKGRAEGNSWNVGADIIRPDQT